MTKSKSTKKALLASAVSLILCFSMLLGTTYAWFTDSVTSTNNKIVAGNLDVDLYLWTGAAEPQEITEESAPIFGAGSLAQDVNAETLWEPGKTQVAYLSIKNNGSLDLKYSVALKVENVAKNLFEVMQYDIIENAKYDEVDDWTGGANVVAGTQRVSEEVPLAAGAEHFFALAIHMEETAGNEYQDGQVNFDLSVLATQITSEFDSFDNQYDKFATVEGKAELLEALAADYDLITLGSDIDMLGESLVIPADKTLTLDLNGYAIRDAKAQTAAHALIDNEGTLTIKDSVGSGKISYEDTTVYSGDPGWVSNTISNKGTLIINGGLIENTSSENVKKNGYPHALDVYPGSVTTINGGTVKSVNYDAIRMFCNSETVATELNITGGTIYNRVTMQDPSSTKAGYGRLNISGGTFVSNDYVTSNVRYLNSYNYTDPATVNEKAVVTGGTFDKGFGISNYSTATVEYSHWLTYGSATEVVTDKVSFEKALTEVEDGDVIAFASNITGDVTAVQKDGVDFTIDGNGFTLNGTLLLNGRSDGGSADKLTIKNINFVATEAEAAAIDGYWGDSNTRYAHNVTVENCTFTMTGDAYFTAPAVDLYQPYNFTMKNCVVTGAHSVLQNKGGHNGITLIGVKAIDCKNGAGVGTMDGAVVVTDCVFDVAGYGFRAENAENAQGATFTNCKFKANIPVVVRKAAANVYSLTFNGTNTMTQTNSEGIWCAIGVEEYGDVDMAGLTLTNTVTVTLNDTGLDAAGVYGEKNI